MKKYEIIYADPPWHDKQKSLSGAAEKHYTTMSLQEICGLPVSELSHDNSVLFLWATFPMLKEALEVIEAWGFKYKTVGFVWIKENRKNGGWFLGLGFWTRGNAEICLLATKGKPKRIHAGVRQLVTAPVSEHSRKPDEVRKRIVELMGDVPRLELFARQKVYGWDVWGNEVESDVTM